MPKITVEDDQFVYEVDIKNKGAVLLDGMELQRRVQDLNLPDDDIPVEPMVKIVRDIMWLRDDRRFTMTDSELYAVGVKVLLAVGREVERLGNSQSGPQISRPAMASSRAG